MGMIAVVVAGVSVIPFFILLHTEVLSMAGLCLA